MTKRNRIICHRYMFTSATVLAEEFGLHPAYIRTLARRQKMPHKPKGRPRKK